MGEVYRARDTRLGREVAIKVLPDAFAQDADRMARFDREAQLLAALNHPNIAAIYGVEDRALVMELVEGSTLAERILQGPIPLELATPIIGQIVDALEYAHEKGVVHRDLKPANIKITPEGRVKVLDFGLAKALSNETAPADPVSRPRPVSGVVARHPATVVRGVRPNPGNRPHNGGGLYGRGGFVPCGQAAAMGGQAVFESVWPHLRSRA